MRAVRLISLDFLIFLFMLMQHCTRGVPAAMRFSIRSGQSH